MHHIFDVFSVFLASDIQHEIIVKIHVERHVSAEGFVLAEQEIGLGDENDARDGEDYGNQEGDGELFFEKDSSEERGDDDVRVDESDAVRRRNEEHRKVPGYQADHAQDGSEREQAPHVTIAEDVDFFDLAKDEHGRDLKEVNERGLFASVQIHGLSHANVEHCQQHASDQSQKHASVAEHQVTATFGLFLNAGRLRITFYLVQQLGWLIDLMIGLVLVGELFICLMTRLTYSDHHDNSIRSLCSPRPQACLQVIIKDFY